MDFNNRKRHININSIRVRRRRRVLACISRALRTRPGRRCCAAYSDTLTLAPIYGLSIWPKSRTHAYNTAHASFIDTMDILKIDQFYWPRTLRARACSHRRQIIVARRTQIYIQHAAQSTPIYTMAVWHSQTRTQTHWMYHEPRMRNRCAYREHLLWMMFPFAMTCMGISQASATGEGGNDCCSSSSSSNSCVKRSVGSNHIIFL